MPIKHQSNCYRNIAGVRYTNYADLIYSDQENQEIIDEAKAKYHNVRLVDRGDCKAVFVANEK